MAEMRVSGLGPYVTAKKISSAVATTGECSPNDVKVGDVRPTPKGQSTAWVRCPLRAANKITEAGSLPLPWCDARVALLEQRPLQCFRCLEGGHVRARCTSAIDRSGHCYRCGQAGHPARSCTAAAHCSVCQAAGRPASHRMGGPSCKPPKGGLRKREEKVAEAAPAPLPQRVAGERARLPPLTGGVATTGGGISPPAPREMMAPQGPTKEWGPVSLANLGVMSSQPAPEQADEMEHSPEEEHKAQ